jgi:hypothetical protein
MLVELTEQREHRALPSRRERRAQDRRAVYDSKRATRGRQRGANDEGQERSGQATSERSGRTRLLLSQGLAGWNRPLTIADLALR